MHIGERTLVPLLARGLHSNKNVLVRAGDDDAAVIEFGGRRLALTTDIMFERTHFPKGMRFEEMGRKITVANLSDLAAMGARPLAFLCSIGLPAGIDARDAKKIIDGINKTCKEYGTPFVGGDTKSAREITLCGFAVGVVEGRALLQKNARAGDILSVTGNIGSAACGLHALLRKTKTKLIHAFTHPHARTTEGIILSRAKIGAATVDITDGLLYSTRLLSEKSKVRIDIEKNKIPIANEARAYARKNNLSEKYLLDTGEDYELLISLRTRDFGKMRNKLARAGCKFTSIGKVSRGAGVFLDGKRVVSYGYDAFER
ncbi:MAG: thiamine-phosphate kinase [Candidatus Micrarchaeota archaeon]